MVALGELAIVALFPLIGLVAVAVGVGALYHAVKVYRRTKRMSDTETTAVRDVEPGVVELKGTARPAEDEGTVSGPISGKDAVASSVTVERYSSGGKHSSWKTIHEQETVRPFVLDDGTGEVRVDPPDAAKVSLDEYRWVIDGDETEPDEVRRFVESADGVDAAEKAGDSLLGSGERRRYEEGVIEPGEDVYVFGQAVESDAGWGSEAYEVTGGSEVGTFVLSDKSEEELTSGGVVGAVVLALFGAFVLFVGGPFLLFGLLALLGVLL